MDLISVVVPFYNAEKYIKSCVESIRNQSYTNLEIILVDDGSTDTSYVICEKIRQSDCRILVIQEENCGISYARNVGIQNANGKYIMFVDSDDELCKDAIGIMYKAIKQYHLDTVIGGYYRINMNGDVITDINFGNKHFEGIQIKEEIIPVLYGTMPSEESRGMLHTVWGKLYDLQIIQENKINFVSEKIFFSEDRIFLIDYFVHATGVKLLDDFLYRYRMNPVSFTNLYNCEKFEQSKKLYRLLDNKINGYKLPLQCRVRLQKTFYIYIKDCLTSAARFNAKEYNIVFQKIVEDPLFLSILKEYPIKKMKMKQRIFLGLLQYKCRYSLRFLLKVNK